MFLGATHHVMSPCLILFNFKCVARLQRSLPAHPNIVRVVDDFDNGAEIVSVAEFVPGELHKLFDVYKASMGGDSKGLPESR